MSSTTMARARSNASPSTCQRAMRINSRNPCVVVASAIMRRPRVEVAAGRPGPQVREGLGESGGVVHLEEEVGDPRLGHPPVEVGDRVGGPVRHGGLRPVDTEDAVFDAAALGRTGPRLGGQPAQTVGQGELALGEPVARSGRDRQAAVGIRDGGNRQQCPPVRKASRRWNSTAVSQAGIDLGAQPPAPLRIRPQEAGRASPSRRCAGRRRLPARAGPRATPRCRACAACAACSAGSGCSPPGRGPTGPPRPCSRARPPWRPGLRDPPIRVGPRSPRRAPRRCPARRSAPFPARRMPEAPRGLRPSRRRAAIRRCARLRDTFCRRSGRGSPPRHRRRTSPTRRRRPRESRGGGCPEARGARRRNSAPPAGAAA